MKHRGEKRKFHFGMPDHDSGNAAGAIAPPKTNPEGWQVARMPRGRLVRALRKRTELGAEALGLIRRAVRAYSENGDNCPMQLRRRVQTH